MAGMKDDFTSLGLCPLDHTACLSLRFETAVLVSQTDLELPLKQRMTLNFGSPVLTGSTRISGLYCRALFYTVLRTEPRASYV